MSNLKSKILKIFLVIFLHSTFYILHSTFCQAFGNFAISYDTLYDVNESGVTRVSQTISLLNKTSDYYATEYTVILFGQDVNKLEAQDNLGPLKLELEKENNETKIHVIFNEKVAGLDKTLKWRLNYETPSLAFKSGLVWEIYLPGVPKEDTIDNYNVTLKIPESFGPDLFIWPKPKENFFWTKNDLLTGGISATFGRYQIFNFKLSYHLENTKLLPVVTEIAIPPETSYQKINYSLLTPRPNNVKIDKDGNWLAEYRLNPNEKKKISAQGFVKIFYQPSGRDILAKEIKKNYLQDQPYWEVKNDVIKKFASNLRSARDIYNYVVSNLKYDYQKTNQRPKRLGALQVLKNKDQAICLEFTDLFIALARASGIPARAVNGFAYTTNSKLRPLSEKLDILHAWPEYYNSFLQNWIMVDPTWGNTTNGLDYFSKLDLNHFTFVKKGLSSLYPYAAGSYKDASSSEKDVFVNFSPEDKEIKPGKLNVYFYLPKEQVNFFPIKGKILVENQGPGSYKIDKIAMSPIHFKEKIKVNSLPPFGKVEIPVNLDWQLANLRKIQPSTFDLSIEINDEVYNYQIKLKPVFNSLIINFIIGGFCVVILSQIAGKARHLFFQK